MRQTSLITTDAILWVAGVDEAGRGPLAGPVSAAAVILDPARPIAGLADSKKLTPARRDALDHEIRRRSLAWAIAWASAAEIDRINILQASLLAMQRAVAALSLRPGRVLVDGNRCPDLGCETRAVIGGDGSIPAIGAASILAKVARDRLMRELDLAFPGYGFGLHKGYPTRDHIAALRRLGPCLEHRRSFGPVRALTELGDRTATTTHSPTLTEGIEDGADYPHRRIHATAVVVVRSSDPDAPRRRARRG